MYYLLNTKQLFSILTLILTIDVAEAKNFKTIRKNLKTVPALLLTTVDSISLIYPQELDYAKDFLQTIYKINIQALNKPINQQSLYRIEDAVYDNHTWSIYFIVSNLLSGSEIIQLTHIPPGKFFNTQKSATYQKETNYQMASNWIRKVIYRNSTAKLLSLDINVKRRKLYWFEFNKLSQKWSIGMRRLNKQHYPTSYFTFESYSERSMFANDGYTFISVAEDSDKNDATLFITNNQTLNICFLANQTCLNYFEIPKTQKNQNTSNADNSTTNKAQAKTTNSKVKDLDEANYDGNYEDYYYVDEYLTSPKNLNSQIEITTANLFEKEDGKSIQPATIFQKQPETSPIYKFGRLMGIKYDAINHSLYLNDYGFDRIERITFERRGSFQFKFIESILKSEYDRQAPINPLMSVFTDNYIFWIDFEEGLKATVYKSTCIRTIYKIKHTTSLKFIEIGTFQDYEKLPAQKEKQNLEDSMNDLNEIIAIQDVVNFDRKIRYPPLYFFNRKNHEKNSFEEKNLDDISLPQRSNQLVSSAELNLHSSSFLNLLFCQLFIFLISNK